MNMKRIGKWVSVLFLLAALPVMTAAVAQEQQPGGPERLVELQTADVVLRPGVYETAGGRYAVVQITRELTRAEHDALAAAGVRLLSYLGDGAYIAGVDPGALTSDLTLAYGIEAAAPWAAGNKAAPALRRGEVADWAMTDGGLLKVSVLFFADVTAEEMEAILSRHAEIYEQEPSFLDWAVQIEPAALDALLLEQGIHAVTPGPVPDQPLLNEVRARLHVDEVQQAVITNNPPSITYNGLTGEGVVLNVNDCSGSVWDGHPDFLKSNGASRFLNPSPGSGAFHATHVAGIMGGGGVQSVMLQNSPWYAPIGTYRGIAPEATFYDQSYSGTTPLIDAMNTSCVMTYGPYSGASGYDAMVRGNNGRANQYPQIWAAANQGLYPQYNDEEGYYSMYAPAKNVISVGSVNANDGSLNEYSSLGPTFDGRIKPDVMAPGGYNSLPKNFDMSAQKISVAIDYIRIVDSSTGHVDMSWEFNQAGNTEGWFDVERWLIEDVAVSGGNLTFQTRPEGYGSNYALSLSTKPSHVISMRYKMSFPAGLATGEARFLWRSDSTDVYLNGYIPFSGIANDTWAVANISVGQWGFETDTYKFQPIDLGGWTGTINRLRIDPFWNPKIVSTARYGSVDMYARESGTSMAAPAVTGSVGLILQQMHEELGIDLTANQPYPSTIKAILIQTADDMIHATADPRDPDNPDTGAPVLYYAGPDFATGYGLINVKTAVDLVAADAGPGAPERLIQEGALDAGQQTIYEMTLTSADITRLGGKLKFTLAWDDAPGDTTTPETTSKLVNDLDLYLIGPTGTIYRPWTLDPLPVVDCVNDYYPCGDPDPIAPSDVVPAHKAADHLNNVEMVQVSGATAGHWQVVVNAYRMPMPVQKFSLVGNEPVALVGGPPPGSRVLAVGDSITFGQQQLAARYPLGDATVDGLVNQADLDKYTRWLNGSEQIPPKTSEAFKRGNADGNLVINANDKAIANDMVLGRYPRAWFGAKAINKTLASYRLPLFQLFSRQTTYPFTFVGTVDTEKGYNFAGYPGGAGYPQPAAAQIAFVGQSGKTTGAVNTGTSVLFGIGPALTELKNRNQSPDVVLLHLGTVDINKAMPWATTQKNLNGILAKLRNPAGGGNAAVKVYIAQIIPVGYPGGACKANVTFSGSCARFAYAYGATTPVQQFNNNLSTWCGPVGAGNARRCANLSTASSPVYLVDQHAGFDVENWLIASDEVYPNRQGECRIALRWYEALRATEFPNLPAAATGFCDPYPLTP